MTKEGLHYFGSIRRSDWLPRQVREEQQVARSYDSQSSDDQDREEEENYGSSGCEDEFDGELGRLCRGEGAEADVVSESSGDEDGAMEMQRVLAAVGERPREEEQDVLASLL